jgi:hypothetical protein
MDVNGDSLHADLEQNMSEVSLAVLDIDKELREFGGRASAGRPMQEKNVAMAGSSNLGHLVTYRSKSNGCRRREDEAGPGGVRRGLFER